jgi:PAS domain S-box-containing protein
VSLICEEFHRAIAKRLNTEAMLRAGEERLSSILNSAMDGIVTIDEQQRITFFNPAAEAMFKCNAAKVMGQSLERLIPERFRSTHAEHIHNFRQTHTTRRSMGLLGAIYGLRSDGEEFPLEASISQAEAGGQKLYSVILRDITERLRSEASVRQQAALIEQTYDALFVWEFDGVITFWNRGAERLYGYLPSEAVGKSSHDLLQTQAPCGVECFRQALLHKGQWEGELNHRLKDGRRVATDSRMVLIERPEGSLVLETVRDITAQKAATEQIKKLADELEGRVQERTAELEASNKELEAFTYSVSHDLRAPLRHVAGFSKLLVERHSSELSPDAKEYVEMIQDSVKQMGILVDDLLNLARLGRARLNTQVTGLNTLVAEVQQDLNRANPGRDIEWKIDSLPFAECDPVLMKQVFVNLLSNAVKYTRPRKPAIIEVGMKTENGGPTVFVRDNGVGFSMKYANKLFGVFQRLHRAEDFEGTGVGLATVQRIIQKHGGRVWGEAELDKGATFYFALGSPEDARTEERRERRRTT